jgi:hypothetical protein
MSRPFSQPLSQTGEEEANPYALIIGSVGVRNDHPPALTLNYQAILPFQLVVGLEGITVCNPGFHGFKEV